MLKDPYGRPLTELRISVTHTCNYRCIFCHREGMNDSPKEISVHDWEKIFQAAKELGIRKIKITGGEPLLYPQIVEFVQTAKKYFEEVSLTTNGYYHQEYAKKLKDAGIDRINVSLHTLNDNVYEKITGVKGLLKVIKGVESAISHGIFVKINVLILNGFNEGEVKSFIKFAREKDVNIQFIEYEPLLGLDKRYHISLEYIEKMLEKEAIAIKIKRRHFKKSYLLPPWIDVLRTWHSKEMCLGCTRLRVLPDGSIIPCIYRGNERVFMDFSNPQRSIIKANNLRRPYWG